jgi:hypothetical protein
VLSVAKRIGSWSFPSAEEDKDGHLIGRTGYEAADEVDIVGEYYIDDFLVGGLFVSQFLHL